MWCLIVISVVREVDLENPPTNFKLLEEERQDKSLIFLVDP